MRARYPLDTYSIFYDKLSFCILILKNKLNYFTNHDLHSHSSISKNHKKGFPLYSLTLEPFKQFLKFKMLNWLEFH